MEPFGAPLAGHQDYADCLASGDAAWRAGRYAAAVAAFGAARALRPDASEVSWRLGEALRLLDRPGEAVACYERVLALEPGHPAATLHLGLALVEAGRGEAAVAWYRKALAVRPDDALLANNLGHALRAADRTREAQACFAAVCARQPRFVEALVNYAVTCRELGEHDAAEAACIKALTNHPACDPALLTLGALRQDRRRHEAAIAIFNRVLARTPDHVAARWNKALSLLTLGRLAEGFALYEAGLGQRALRGLEPDPARRLRELPRPGQHLLLWAEQGFGDAMQFVRYAPLCRACGATVTVACPQPLQRLFAGCPGVDAVVETPGEAAYDRQAALLSLPHLFGTTLDTVPADVPYLRVDDAVAASWRRRFPEDGRPRVGLAWAGNPRGELPESRLVDRRRSLSLENFLPLLARSDVAFYSLQKGEAAGQIAALGLGGRLIDLMDGVDDFLDTAALVEQLDLVIAVDTAVVHLAGALGRPVWVLSRFDACWRWLGNRETNPWYPTARVFGQPAPGDWAAVIDRVAAELAGWQPGRARP